MEVVFCCELLLKTETMAEHLFLDTGGNFVTSFSLRCHIGIRGLLQCASAQVQRHPSQKFEASHRAGVGLQGEVHAT